MPRMNQLYKMFKESRIFSLIYDEVLGYLCSKGNERTMVALQNLFKERYGITKEPRQCFINLYDANVLQGVSRHRDCSSFCSVVIALTEDHSQRSGLFIETESRAKPCISYKCKVGDMIIFDRLWHGVYETKRPDRRGTCNMFF
jgi:hypothetical protein